jgi:hypothetical protein
MFRPLFGNGNSLPGPIPIAGGDRSLGGLLRSPYNWGGVIATVIWLGAHGFSACRRRVRREGWKAA